ncbi:beta-ketoacyl synthase N-terminal-like domain-containing protein [Arthrobacter sp. KNU40]|uniref:beta-ketoacyl synthase N-terminal-like domain-containing protein n=1 Tax=Arthrobacter sp. KNU40 TaxID=3447965 RepID=UPI003F5E8B1F
MITSTAVHPRTETKPPGDIALIGIALRVPGAEDIDTFWSLIAGGRTTFEAVTPEDSARFGYSPAQRDSDGFVPIRSALDDFETFDAELFGINSRDASLMDPQHRVFLETVRSALDDAGFDDNLRGLRVGVFGSSSSSTYLTGPVSDAGLWDTSDINFSAMLANEKDFLCTRTSYTLGLTGPSVVVQSACSSSLLAVHLARMSLQSGECDIAVVGGVSVSLPHLGGYLYRAGSIFSPTGGCRPFDASADGTVKANGAGAIVLSRSDDAPDDYVYAHISGSAANNDGAEKPGFPAPGIAGQSAVIGSALTSAGLQADKVRYVEAHGTGTPIGDPIEVRALRQARGSAKETCYLGSVKANIGHLDAAAGVVGLIKAALVLERAIIPPIAGYEQPNPLLNLGDTLTLPTECLDASWLDAAGVSSFGMGGTNVHVVLRRRSDRGRRPAAPPKRSYSRVRYWLDAPSPASPDMVEPLKAARVLQNQDVPSETDLLDMARRTLMAPDITIDDDFVDAGADSLALIDLLSQVRERFAADLSYTDIERSRTVRSLLDRILRGIPTGDTNDRSGRSRPASLVPAVTSNLVAVSERGTLDVFLVHPAGGTTTIYAGLAPHVDPTLNLIALSFPDEYLGRRCTMRDLAENYLAAIRGRQPHGPYLIGGYSFGGNLATEIALQLRREGEVVERLVMIDSHPPHAYTSGDCGDGAYLAAFPALLEVLVPGIRFEGDVSTATNARTVLDHVASPAWPASVRTELARFFDIWKENHGVLKRWTPDRDLDCPVLIIEASDPEPQEILDRLGIASSSVHEWDRYLGSEADVVKVAGDHYSIFRDPAPLRAIGQALSGALVSR